MNQVGFNRVYTVDSLDFTSDKYRNVLVDWKFNGRRFKYSGKLPFSLDAGETKTYSTYFGPIFDNPNRCVYSQNVNNYNNMLFRIVGIRSNEELKTRNNLRISPHRGHRGVSRMLHSYYSRVKSNLEPYLDYVGDVLLEQIKTACAPHIKQKLRIKAIKELLATADKLNKLFMEKISGKIKIPEFAKAGKKPRMIGDYSTPGSLLAAFLIPLIKYAFSIPVNINGSIIRFVYSTDAEELDSIFNEADSYSGDYYIFFSDDMTCRISRNGESFWCNLDISSCDASNGPAVFSRAVWFFDRSPEYEDLIQKCVMQCMQPLCIFHPDKNIKERVVCRPTIPIEFSGTQLTTLLNNIASASICVSLIYHKERYARLSLSDYVDKSALAFGYEVTVQKCDDVEDIQFLKHSFWRDDLGRLNSFVNIGALFRSFGTSWMDVPFSRKKGEDMISAFKMRNRQMLLGFQHSGLDIIIDVMLNSSYATASNGYSQLINSMETEKVHKMYIDSHSMRKAAPLISLIKRYRWTFDEYFEMIDAISKASLGSSIQCAAVDKIMHYDYGYSLLTR